MEMLPGTVIGVKARDGVVIGGEKRLSYEGFILSRSARKVFPVTDYVGVGFAGLMGDIQFLVKILKYEAKRYELDHSRRISPRNLAKMLSLVLYSYKLFPMFTEVVVGGISRDGKPEVFVLDPVGSLIEEKYVALGSGGRVALGYIEPNYRDDISIEDAKKLVVGAIKTAIERDVLSGDGVDLLVITRSGYSLEEYVFKRGEK
ncbi:MAG: proteasome subunit beta [Thermoprotei archaeon]|nr:MAG: proteasome subunit beta [Thermoprotei archaeon]